jgi:putative ATP-binding cassette transporter
MAGRVDKAVGNSRSMLSVLSSVISLSRGFWTGPTRKMAWGLTIAAFGMALVDILMQLALNRWNKTFYDALERKSFGDIKSAALLFLVLIAAATTTVVLAQLARILLQIHWREDLTQRLVDLWLKNQAFYRLNVINGNEFAPEARIAEDLRLTVEPIVDLIIGFVSAVITFGAFVGILWHAGGSLSIGGMTIPGFMVFGAIIYSTVVSGFMFAVANKYSGQIRERSEAEAQLRYQLTRLRENAESVALIKGEADEQRNLFSRLATVVDRWRGFAFRWSYMTVVVSASSLAAPVFPVLLMAPKYMAGEVTLGTVMQVAAAFGSVNGALSWFTANFARLSEWYAAASRVSELGSYIRAAALPDAEQTQIEVSTGESEVLELEKVAVRLHNGKTLIADAGFTIGPGERVLVEGESGTGKSTLVRAIAGLWPWGSGRIVLPKSATLAFVPQRPYMPIGLLKAAVTYPRSPDEFPDEEVGRALELCGLPTLKAKLADAGSWDRILSGGEQQRIAFARLLLHRPSLVILDEATSALDEPSQARVMDLFESELPHAALISVAHRPSLARYHNRHIQLHKAKKGARVLERMRQMSAFSRMRDAIARRPRRGKGGAPGPR